MTTDKYEIAPEYTTTVGPFKLYRIRALRDVPGGIKKGECGGFVSGPESLSQEGNCWIHRDAMVFDGAEVRDNAVLKGMSRASSGAVVMGDARLENRAQAVGKVVLANSERLHACCMLMNITILQCSQFMREGDTTFTFAYQAGRTLGAFAIPIGPCGDPTALALSLYQAGQSMALYASSEDVLLCAVPDATGVLEYVKVFEQL